MVEKIEGRQEVTIFRQTLQICERIPSPTNRVELSTNFNSASVVFQNGAC